MLSHNRGRGNNQYERAAKGERDAVRIRMSGIGKLQGQEGKSEKEMHSETIIRCVLPRCAVSQLRGRAPICTLLAAAAALPSNHLSSAKRGPFPREGRPVCFGAHLYE